ncbi:MAG: hypothetical protein WCV91_05595 [Candidatus Margulisiibacteriota bacterium]
MKRFLIGILIASAILAGANAEQMPFQLFYWIAGNVADINGNSANGRTVVLYDPNSPNNKATATIVGNTFILNAYDMYPNEPVPGQTLKLAIAKGPDGFGMDPIDVVISDKGAIVYAGADSPIKLAQGSGVDTPDVPDKPVVVVAKKPEPAPKIKILFGNRLYQKDLVAKGYKQVVSAKPEIKVEVSIDDPYTLASDISGYTIVIDENNVNSKNINLGAGDIKEKSVLSGSSDQNPKISGIKISSTLAEALSEGKHTIKITAKSSGQNGLQTTAIETADVEVIGGELRVLNQPLAYPSPFSATKNGEVFIQYELSADADINAYISSVDGTVVKKYMINSGVEGGRAGINKITWNGRADQGFVCGNGIYVGIIAARESGKVLQRFRLTIVN